MSVSGSRKAKELGETYSKMVYGDSERDRKNIVKVSKRKMFCPKCGRYLQPNETCSCETI